MIGSKDWPQVRLKDIVHEECSISYGIVQPGDDIEEGVPIVRPVDMNDTHLIDKNTLKRTSRQISDSYSRTILRGDEILVCVRGTTGLIALANGLKGCNVTRGITPLYFKPQYNREYLFRAFLGEKVQKYIQENTIGSTLKGINMSKLREMPICMPPTDIQNQYVSIANQADKSEFGDSKSQFIENFEFCELNLNTPSNDFDDLCYDDTASCTKIPAGEYLPLGKYAIYDQSQDNVVAGYTDEEQGLCKNYPAVLFGDHSRVIKYIDEPFFIGADGVKIIRPKTEDILPEFLFYDLKYHNIPNTGYNRHFKYIKMLKLTKATMDEQNKFLTFAHQADKSEYELRSKIDAIDNDIKSFINANMKRIEYRYTLGKNTFIIMDGSICKENPIFV